MIKYFLLSGYFHNINRKQTKKFPKFYYSSFKNKERYIKINHKRYKFGAMLNAHEQPLVIRFLFNNNSLHVMFKLSFFCCHIIKTSKKLLFPLDVGLFYSYAFTFVSLHLLNISKNRGIWCWLNSKLVISSYQVFNSC